MHPIGGLCMMNAWEKRMRVPTTRAESEGKNQMLRTMTSHRMWLVLLVALTFSRTLTDVTLAQPCLDPIPGDLDGDGDVDVDDHAILYGCMTGPDEEASGECIAADLDLDLDVDLADFAALTLGFTGALPLFDYRPSPRDNREAELLAVETSGEFLAPDGLYDRIRRDLALIRDFDSRTVNVVHDERWVPNQAIVKLRADMGTENYDEFNRFHRAVDCDLLFGTWWVVSLPDVVINAVVLSTMFADLPEVELAEPNFLIGTDDKTTVSPGQGSFGYRIEDGFLDCFDGCDCFRIFEFTVTDGGDVTLDSYEERGQKWCEF